MPGIPRGRATFSWNVCRTLPISDKNTTWIASSWENTWWSIIADSRVRWHVWSCFLKTCRATIACIAANLGGGFPEKGGKVANLTGLVGKHRVGVCASWGGLPVVGSKVLFFTVVPEIGNRSTNLASSRSSRKILTIIAPANCSCSRLVWELRVKKGRDGRVVSEYTSLSKSFRMVGQNAVPSQERRRVISAVNVVMLQGRVNVGL